MRRRARFLRKARELAYRDLGGLVFDLHRFGERNDQLVLTKLATLSRFDTELRALEGALGERRGITVLREVGVAVCPRCAAIHSGDDHFCPGCGLEFDAHAELPIATTPTTRAAPAAEAPGPAAAPAPALRPSAPPAPAPAPTSAPAVPEENRPTQIIHPPAASP